MCIVISYMNIEMPHNNGAPHGPPSGAGCANTEISAIIINELRETYGIKYRKEKKQKTMQDKHNQRRIFNVPLDKLEMTDVILANGGITQVPLFVSDACQRILEQVSTEGLFRKAGSTARQREIRSHLEGGARLGKSHHVIDVANVLKLFLRELPEPILAPGNIQESVLRCLLCGDRKVNALLLSVLLLPTLSLNTLTFFMQFLLTVSQHSAQNRMTSENLAIIFTPGLMPLPENIPQRLSSHCKVVQMLIEHANQIGTVPRYLLERSRLVAERKLAASIASSASTSATSSTPSQSFAAAVHPPDTDKKKKKRRSGSLTRMFNGLRKIVGSAIGSNDELDRSHAAVGAEANPSTPCVKQTGKKRKVLEGSGFSAKKKKDVLALLPENGAMLPATPMCSKNFTKKSRLSIGGKRFDKKNQQHHATPLPAIVDAIASQPVMERRWSVVGTGWPRKKSTTATSVRKSMTAACADLTFSPPQTVSTPPVTIVASASVAASSESLFSSDYLSDLKIGDGDNESDFMRISKSEYEAIKERVTAIESRISKEFQTIHETQTNMDNSFNDLNTSIPTAVGCSSVVDQVMDKYEKTLDMQQTTTSSSPSTDLLAKRLSRELKIRRRSSDQPIIRSPSARKIGTMQRRSRENVRLSRNFSWHMTPNMNPPTVASQIVESPVEPMIGALHPMIKASLKRGRPNTVQTGLRHPSPTKKPQSDCDEEQWTSAEQFFAGQHTPVKANQENSAPLVATTPFFVTTASMNEIKTPMLPPRRPVNLRTPLTINNANRTPMLPPRSTPIKPTSAIINKALILTPMEDTVTGRASIARLRSQNAGMVAAKAKLFNGFVTETAEPPPPSSAPTQEALPRESTLFAFQHFAAHRINKPKEAHRTKASAPRPSFHGNMNNSPRKSMTPRRGTKNLNGIHRRQKLRLAKSPINKGSPMRLHHLLLEEATNSHAMSLVKDVTKHSSPRGKPSAQRSGFHAAMQSIVNESPAKAPAPNTPHIKPSLGLNSPRRLAKTPAPQRSTPIRLRHSPSALQLFRQCGAEG